MKLTIVILISLLTSSSIAHPHRRYHNKRQDDVWVTNYNLVIQTIDISTTISVQEGFGTSHVLPLAVSTCTSPAYDFHTTSTITAPPVCHALVETLGSSTSILTDAAKCKSNSTYTPSEATTSSALAPSATSSPPSSECSRESPCKGDITYYTAGLGACGFVSNGDIQNVVALPHGLMGTKSNGNPYCGMTITITCVATSKTTTATVVDKCIGCNGFSIDLSNAAFLDLDDLAVGRTSATWYFN